MNYLATYDSPVGRLLLESDGHAITGLRFVGEEPNGDRAPARPSVLSQLIEQLDAYFAGELVRFRVAVAPAGTLFQQAVWQALKEIPFGKTASYSEIARSVQAPKAVRAVGMANSRNPIAILLPCHRVIGSSGQLTGYAGGLERKRWLLEHESGFGQPALL